MIARKSPFQDWMDKNLQGIAFSKDIHELIAMAFAGGLDAAIKECDNLCEKAVDSGYTTKAETFIDGFGDGALACSCAIRSLK